MKTILWVVAVALGCALRLTAASAYTEVASIPRPPNADSSFGTVVAISGDTLVATAPNESTADFYAGAAYVFVNNNGSWTLQARLAPPQPAAYEQFGISAAIHGDTIVIGSYGDSGVQYGAAYVFSRSGQTWSLAQQLVANDVFEFQAFGISVAVSADTIAVGAFSDAGFAFFAGSVYAYVQNNGTWVLQQKISAENPIDNEFLGYSVAIDGDTIVAGAPYADGYIGAAYVFTREQNVWSQKARLTAPGLSFGAILGSSVAVSGNTVLCGAPTDPNTGVDRAGTVHAFAFENDTWSYARIVPADPYPQRYFGWSVAILGDSAVIGAPQEHDGLGTFTTRAAYLFSRSNGAWTERQRLTPSNTDPNQMFGLSVALTPDRIIVGDVLATSLNSAVYVYEIPQNAAPVITCTQPLQTIECVTGAVPVTASVDVSDPDGNALTVVWSVNGVPFHTSTLSAGTTLVAVPLTSAPVALLAGTNTFDVTVSDGKLTAGCQSVAVLVPDTQAPVVTSTTATPNTLARSGKMIPVQVSVAATDNCSAVTSRITNVLVSDTTAGRGAKKRPSETDFEITGALTVNLNSHVTGPVTRVYTIVVESSDASGNVTTSTGDVTVLK